MRRSRNGRPRRSIEPQRSRAGLREGAPMAPLGLLVLVTAVWGITFVQIKDALELYPLFAFLAVRFAIAVAVLAVPAARRVRSLGREGAVAGLLPGDLLVLAGAALYALQIALMERFAPRYDPLAFTTAEMVAAFVGFVVIAVAAGQVEVPHGATVWGALLVTGVFASA